MKKLFGFLGVLGLLVVGSSAPSQGGDNIIDIPSNSKTAILSLYQYGTSDVFKIENLNVLVIKAHGYSADTQPLKQEGANNSILFKRVSSKDGFELAITQQGSNNTIDFSNADLVSQNGNIFFNVLQTGNDNELKVINGIFAFDDINIDVKEENGYNKINLDTLDSTAYVRFKVYMYNTGADMNQVGGVSKFGDINGLDDLLTNSKLAFDYSKGLYASGNGIDMEISVYGSGNKIGIYQVSDSGKANVKVSLGDKGASEVADNNTVILYQHATSGKDAYADVTIFGSGRTLRLYQEGDARATVLVKRTYSSSAPIRIYQQTYEPSSSNDVKVTFE